MTEDAQSENLENEVASQSDSDQLNIDSNSSSESIESKNENKESISLDSEKDNEEKSIHELPLPGEMEEKEKKERLPKWAEKRLSKKDREISQRVAEAEMYKAELERLKANPALSQPSPSHDMNAPRREDYATDDDYIDARIDYKQKKDFYVRQTELQRMTMIEAENEFKNKLKDALDSGAEKYDDFEDKTEILFRPDFPPNRAMAEAIVDSAHRDDILYFLGNYADEARKIAKMNPVQAVKEIAKLESRFAEKRRSNLTKAPAPVTPLNSNQGKASEGNPEKMNMSDFTEWYKSKYGTR